MGIKRWWGVRHLRYLWQRYHLQRWEDFWRPYGSVVRKEDWAVLQNIWEGKA